MKKNKSNNNIVLISVILCFCFGVFLIFSGVRNYVDHLNDNNFYLLASTSVKTFEDELMKFADKENIDLTIEYLNDIEIVDELNSNPNKYDGVWMSNSLWLYMLDNSYLVSDSKSIAIDPVLIGIKKSKAEKAGFVNKDVYNKDILNAISNKKFNYVMTSVTTTNTGATAYLGFLNSLAGSPEVLTSNMLQDNTLKSNLKSFFSGVERVSGDEDYLKNMFINGGDNYDAVITYESTLIDINKELASKGKEPLYLVYPVDGVSINDMPFGYVENQQGKEDIFQSLQDFLRSDSTREKLENEGFRTWYGGVKENTNSKVFNKEWGIDTTKYLTSLKYPSKAVINDAFTLYMEEFRKPSHVVFCLDTSGSMYGDGISQLKEAMNYILDKEQASKDFIQFSSNDKITIITFNSRVDRISKTFTGNQLDEAKEFVDSIDVNGGTNIYDSSSKAIDILNNETNNDNYTRTVILMTDGQSNSGNISSLESKYNKTNSNIPIYSIMFGSADESQLNDIANLTNGKVFDGKSGLKKAFKEVRSYS